MLDGLPSIYKALGLIPQCCKTNQLSRIKLLLFKLISYSPLIFQTHSNFFLYRSIFFLGRHNGACLQFKHLGVWDNHKFKASQIMFNSPF